MFRSLNSLWQRLFLEERPSISLAFFRLAVAVTVACHVMPSLFFLEDNYLATAFRTVNPSFFSAEILDFVWRLPDGVVYFFTGLFYLAWGCFFLGVWTQGSCLLMVLACYFFYARNAFHIGTLSWDILLVTLVLMCLTAYPGDYFSLDALRRGDPAAYKKPRPFFLQRLLQMQIAATFFYTALIKITAEGNWLTDNPLYYLYNYPPEGVTKAFLFREFLAASPRLCYFLGVFIVGMELMLPFLLFHPASRFWAIGLGCLFHGLLVWTLHVPTIFFFLFPAQLLLFINPNGIIRWLENRREVFEKRGRALLIYDGHCQFCQGSIRQLQVMDIFGYTQPMDYHTVPDLSRLHPDLDLVKSHSQLHLIEPDGRLWGGFFVFRRICFYMPMLWPFIVLLYFPGMNILGPWLYRLVANNRYLFHLGRPCRDNACFR